MHRSELRQEMECSDCGALVKQPAERSFAFGSRGLLCLECGLRRGGRYDEALDRWLEEPQTDDLGREYE